MHRYLTEEDRVSIESSETFDDLLLVALRILGRMPQLLVQISGPITTGGMGSEEENSKRIIRAKKAIQDRGYHVFDYLIFQEPLGRIKNERYPSDRYCIEMLEIFFRGLFESGYISMVFFLPDWESSTGARWERQVAFDRGLEIVDISPEWLGEASCGAINQF